jgi:Caspase domain
MLNLKESRLTQRVLAALVFIVFSCQAAYGQGVTEATKLRILLVIDTHGDNAANLGFDLDRDHLRNVMETELKKQGLRYTLTVLQGNDATPQKVLRYYESLKSNSSEALFFYYTGHGCFVPGKGQVLGMKHGSLSRSQLREAMMKHNPKLAVILTDCCSSGVPESTPVAKEGKAMPKTEVALPKGSGSVLRDLLFRHEGLVVITAAKIGEFGWATKKQGSYFGGALVKLLQAPVAQFDRNHNGLVEWREFFPKLRQQTQQAADAAHHTQIPQAFYLGQKFAS